MIEKIDASRANVRKFGWLFGGICLLIAAYSIYRGTSVWPWWVGGAAAFFAASLLAYPLLKPIYIGWMAFAFVLGWINTRLILGIFFYLILTPIGVLMRLAGKDFLDERINREAGTYWIKRPEVPFDRTRCERLF